MISLSKSVVPVQRQLQLSRQLPLRILELDRVCGGALLHTHTSAHTRPRYRCARGAGDSEGRQQFQQHPSTSYIHRPPHLTLQPGHHHSHQTRCQSTTSQDPKVQTPRAGTTTPIPDDTDPTIPSSSASSNSKPDPQTSPFYFEAGYALYAKRPSRPFPPPFLSKPSTSFSEPLSTHDKSRDRRPKVNGEMIRGVTNGDDAVVVEENFIGANDGVGAWAVKERGHAA